MARARDLEKRLAKMRRRAELRPMMYLELIGLELTEVPDWALDRQLLTLDLHDNELCDLPSELALLSPTLELLDIRRNPMTEVPPVIRKLTRLQELYLCRTQITHLPSWLAELPDLKTVQCLGLDVSADEVLNDKIWPRPSSDAS